VASIDDLEVVVEQLPAGGAVVRVTGELDLANVWALREKLESTSPSAPLVVDLTECSFLDSSAMRALLETARKAEPVSGRVAVVAPAGGIRKALEIAGVDTVVPIHSTLAEAL